MIYTSADYEMFHRGVIGYWFGVYSRLRDWSGEMEGRVIRGRNFLDRRVIFKPLYLFLIAMCGKECGEPDKSDSKLTWVSRYHVTNMAVYLRMYDVAPGCDRRDYVFHILLDYFRSLEKSGYIVTRKEGFGWAMTKRMKALVVEKYRPGSAEKYRRDVTTCRCMALTAKGVSMLNKMKQELDDMFAANTLTAMTPGEEKVVRDYAFCNGKAGRKLLLTDKQKEQVREFLREREAVLEEN